MVVDPRLTSDGGEAAEPPGWWGPVWARPHRRSLLELVASEVIDPLQAAVLWTIVEQGRSLAVAAGPSGAGKTTLLTSLLDAIPPSRHRHFVRGLYERVDDLRALPVAETTLLINEISPHLPIYSWGPTVKPLLEAARDGCQLLATIHAISTEEVVASLAGYPLRIDASLIAMLGTIVFLDAWQEGERIVRMVRSIAQISFDSRQGGVTVTEIAGPPRAGVGAGQVALFGLDDAKIFGRVRLIADWANRMPMPDAASFSDAMRAIS